MSEREDIIRGGETEYPPEEGPSSEWPSVISPTTNHDNDSSNITPNLVSLNEGTTNTESVRSGSLDFNLDLDDDDALDEELESPTFDLEPFIEEFQIADQFQNTLPVPTYNPLDLNTKPSEAKRRLIPLKPSQSDTAKDVRGTQWKNGHIFINEHKCLPKDWAHAPTGIGLRFRIQGGCASRRIIIQLLVHQDSKLVFTPSFEIHPCHVKDFSMKDRSINEAVESKIKQKRKDDFVQQESYVIFAIGLHSGGVGFGLDYNAKFLTMADRQLLWYLRRLSVNYPENDSTPQRIIFRINARWIDYEETESNSNVRRKIEARDRLYAQIDEFEKDAAAQKQIFSPYRSQQDVPVTQWGQFVPRQTVEEESQGLVAFRARASFSSLHEYQITLAYASHLEWEREREIADFVSAQWHGVAFILVNKSTVLALLKLNMPKPSENEKGAFNIEHWAPREGNTACISFRPPNKLSIGNIKCYGICTANVFDLPYPSGTLFHIVAQNVDFYAQFAVGVGRNLKFLPARLFLDVPISGAKRQVDAINRLCKPEPQLARFSTLLLNRNYQQKRKRYNDPLDSLEISDEVIKNAINVVTSVEGITWSSSQLLCLQKHVRNFPNDLLIIQGYPGTGKTLTLIGLASIYRSLGLHVIMTAPTHFAADAICEGIQKWERLSGTELKPLRVYRPLSESGAFRNHGKSFTNLEGDTVSQDEGESLSGGKDETILPTTSEESTASVVEFPSNSTTIIPESKPEISPPAASEEGTTPIVKSPSNGVAIVLENKPESTPTTVSEEGTVAPMIEPPSGNAPADPENSAERPTDIEIPMHDQSLIDEYLKITRGAHHNKYYSRVDISLEAKVFEMASDTTKTLMARLPSDEQADAIKGDWFARMETGDLVPEGAEVDVLALLRDYAERLRESEYRKLDGSERKTALWAFKTASKAVIRETHLLISTNNNTGDPIIASNFGHDAKGIIIIRDEDFKELEVNSWIPVSKLAAAEKIKGVVSCGDAQQLLPTVLSKYGDPCNEFSAQLALSLPSRLLQMNHPSVKLTEQFRYRDAFIHWLNYRTYGGELFSHPSVEQFKVNSGFINAMKEVLDYKQSTKEVDFGYLMVSIEGSSCDVEEVSKSRFNDPHRRFCLQLVKANFKHRGYAGNDITIVTPYTAQVVRIRQNLFKMVQQGLLPMNEMPTVATVDSMQGKESKVIIYDWTISAANRGSDLGFTSDDHRCNVGLSRMTEVLIVLIPEAVGTGALSEPKAQKYNELGEIVEKNIPYPCAFVQWAQKQKILRTVNGQTNAHASIDESPATEANTGGGWSSAPAPNDEAPATEADTGGW